MVLNTNTVTKRQEEIFNSIQNIQTIERDLYNLLNDLSVVEPDSEMQKRIINQIESLSKIRINMLKDLTSMYNKLHVNITDSKVNLNDQQKVTDIIDNELKNAKKKLNVLRNEKNNKQRMTNINVYHGKKYNAHANVMKILLISCILVLILTFVNKRELLPQNIVVILIGIIIFYGGLRITLLVIDISRRDNMNYDKYKWDFNPGDVNIPERVKETEDDADTDADNIFNKDCVGEDCCSDGMEYDSNTKTCKHKTAEIPQHNYLQYHDHESHVKHNNEPFMNGLSVYPWGKSSYNVKPYNSKI